MQAMEYHQYGGPEVFALTQALMPKPKDHEVLIRMHAGTVTAADIMMRKGKPLIGRLYLGIRRPKRKILGFEFAGEVVETGSRVTRFKVGDRVFGGTTTLGCYAEYTCISEQDVITVMPENISYAQAAPVSGSAITVLNFLVGLANIQKGQKILIIGASGGVGTYAVQIAKHYGAIVTGVCSTRNLALVKALGADHVIDYTTGGLAQLDAQFDIVLDTVNTSAFSELKRYIVRNGLYLPTVFGFKTMLRMIGSSLFGGIKIKTSSTGMLSAKKRVQHLEEIKTLLSTGKIKTVIDRTYPLSQMAEAHAYVQQGHKQGNVVIEMHNNN